MLRVAAITELQNGAWFALVYVHCMARIGPVWLMATEPYVSDAASAKSRGLFQTSGVHVATALGWGAACATLGIYSGLLSVTSALSVVLVLALLTPLCARYFRKAVGGITGDLLGATEQVGEISAWVTIIAVANVQSF
jgi:adenosylcobinamide-GDP ribazoletransferase